MGCQGSSGRREEHSIGQRSQLSPGQRASRPESPEGGMGARAKREHQRCNGSWHKTQVQGNVDVEAGSFFYLFLYIYYLSAANEGHEYRSRFKSGTEKQ